MLDITAQSASSTRPAHDRSSGYARYVGRVGALAVALGIGTAVLTAPGIARAVPSGDSSSSSDASAESGSTGQATPPSKTKRSATESGPIKRPRDTLSTGGTATNGAAPRHRPAAPPSTASEADTSDGSTPQKPATTRPGANSRSTHPHSRPTTPKSPDSSAAAGIPASTDPASPAPSVPSSASPQVAPAENPTQVAVVNAERKQTSVSAPSPTQPAAPSPISVLTAIHNAIAAMLSPDADSGPTAPVESPLLWALMGWVRKLGDPGSGTNAATAATQQTTEVVPEITGETPVADEAAPDVIVKTAAAQPLRKTAEPAGTKFAPAAAEAESATTTSTTESTAPTHGLPADLERTTVVSGLTLPIDMEFLPDGRMLVAELGGAIKIVHDDHVHTAITLTPSVGGERGIGGIAVDPHFGEDMAGTGYIYVSYTASNDRDRLSRFTLTGDTIDANSEVVLMQGDQPTGIVHHGGEVTFGPDGKIYWSTGNNNGFENSQDLSNIYGKVMRLNPDGTAPDDNPFVNTPGVLPQIYAYGFRNAFRFSFTANGKLLVGDVGEGTWEELNVITPGGNYGWPAAEGNCSDCSFINPIYAYNHNGAGAAIQGVLVYTGDALGPEYKNKVFISDGVQDWIKVLTFDPEYSSFISEDMFDDSNTDNIVKLAQGPDGNIYQIGLLTGTISKIALSSGDRAPTAVITASPSNGYSPLHISFSGANSSDPEGQPLTYTWDFGDPARTDDVSTDRDATWTYGANGSYQVTLTVSDGTKTGQATKTIVVGSTPPVAQIQQVTTPRGDLTYYAGDTITFSALTGTGTDPDDGALPESAYHWTIDMHHNTHLHPFATIQGSSGTITVPRTPDQLDSTFYRITLSVTDSSGLTSTQSIDVTPRTVALTVNAVNADGTPNPDLTFTIDGQVFKGSHTETAVVGVERAISGPITQFVNGQQVAFDQWSDGSGQTHVITTPATDTNLTVKYAPAPVISGPTTSAPTGTAPWAIAASGTKVYVVNQGSNSVTVVDRANPTATPITISNVATAPTAIVLGPAGSNRAYIAGNNTLSVINTATNQVTATVATGGGQAFGMALSPNGQRLYLGMTATNQIAVVDTTTATPTIVNTIGVGTMPTEMALSADGNRLYVTSFVSNNVSVVNTATNTVIRTIDVGTSPFSVVVSPDGNRVYVANYGSNTVSVLDPTAATALVTTITVGNQFAHPSGLALSPDGTLLYAANANDTVAVIKTKANIVINTIVTDTFPEYDRQDITVSPDGRQIYVADLADQTVRILTLGTANQAPVVSATQQSPNQATGAITGSVNGVDPEGTPLSYALTGAASTKGSVTLDSVTGGFVYTPSQAARLAAALTPGEDLDTFTITATDGQLSTPTTITVAVLPATITPTSTTPTGTAPWAVAASNTKIYVVNQASNSITVIDRANPNATPITINNVASAPTSIILGTPGSNRAYVAGNNTLTVINTLTNQVTATLTTNGGQSFGMALSPNGQRLYLGMSTTNQVAVINTTTATPTILGVIGVGTTPTEMALSADGNRLYVNNFGSGTLSVINTSSNAVTRTITVGANPFGVVVSPDGNRVYVANFGSSSVSVLDPTATTPLLATITVGTNPFGLALSPDGTLLYTANSNDTITVIDTTTNTITRTLTTDPQPENQLQSITVSPDGQQIYLTDFADNVVRTITLGRGNTAPIIGTPSVSTPDTTTGAVTIGLNSLDPDGDTLSYTVTQPTKGAVTLNGTGGFVYTPTQAARLAAMLTPGEDLDTFTITATDGQLATPITISVAVLPATGSTPTTTQTGAGPWAVASSATKVYVVNQTSNSVTVIDRANPAATPITISNVASAPTSIALGPTGSNRAYVGGNNTLSVINTATNTVIATLTTGGGQAFGMALSPNGQRLYLGMSTANQVAVIDTTTATPTITSTITVGTMPTGLATSADGTRLYVSSFAGNSVSVIDTATNAVIRTIAAGASPFNVAVSPDGNRVYVANFGSNTVSVLDPTATTPLIATIPVGTNPFGLVLSPDGTLLYTANSNDTLTAVDTTTNTILGTVPTDPQPENQLQSITVSPDGQQIYLADFADNVIRTITLGRGNTAPIAGIPAVGTSDPVSGAVNVALSFHDADGDALSYTVTQPAKGTVTLNGTGGYIYTPSQAARLAAALTPGEDLDTFTITATDGQLASPITVTVTVLPATITPTSTTNTGTAPWAAAASSTKIYVVNQTSNSVTVIDRANPNASPTTIAVATGPTGIVLGPPGSNRAYVGGNNTLTVINTLTNQVTATLTTNGGQTFGMAQSPNGQRLYIGMAGSNKVAVINTTTATPTILNTITVGTMPSSLTTSPDGSRIYVTNQGSQNVSVIDTATNTVIRTIAAGVGPSGVVVSPTGDRIYVSNFGYSTVSVINPTAATPLIATIPVGTNPFGLALSPDGTLLYTANSNDTITIVDTTTNTVARTITTDPQPETQLQSITLSPDGQQIYLTDLADNVIRTLTLGTDTPVL